MIEAKLNQLSDLLIRPRRRDYPESDLGPTFFKTPHGYCVRRDFQVEFKYGSTYGYQLHYHQNREQISEQPAIMLKCSIFFPTKSPPDALRSQGQVCVLGLHGNTGSRISTISLLEPVIGLGMSFVVFDFAGCGNSQGEYVTLGYYEKYQISAVLDHIHRQYGLHRFILYGRSMGAASTLFYSTHVYPHYVKEKSKKVVNYYTSQMESYQKQSHVLLLNIACKFGSGYFGYQVIGIILDSPYYDTKELFMGAVGRRLWFVPSSLIAYLLNSVETRALVKLKNAGMICMNEKFDAEQKKKEKKGEVSGIFSLVNDIKIPTQAQISYPVFVLYGLQDDVIGQSHIWELFKKLQCKNKKLHVLEDQGHGGHREDALKVQSLRWVLQVEYEALVQKTMRNAALLGIDIEEYVNYSFQSKEGKKNEVFCKSQLKESELVVEMISEKTLTITSLQTGQVRNDIGSMTSLQESMDQPRKLKNVLISQIKERFVKNSSKYAKHKVKSTEDGIKALELMQIIQPEEIQEGIEGRVQSQEKMVKEPMMKSCE